MENMRELVDELNKLAYAYYALDAPLKPDAEYDALFDKLLELEKETGVILEDSPTQSVGAAPLAVFAKHRHLARLWSMDKRKSKEEVTAWVQKTEKAREAAGLSPSLYTLEHKLDGLSINLTYSDGKLEQAATRGDGSVGEVILEQVKTIADIPRAIPFKGRMEIHGECFMRLSVLEDYNKTAAEPLKNARNGAAGALRNLDPRVTAARKLDAFFYNIGFIEGRPQFSTYTDMMEFIIGCGFPVSDYFKSFKKAEELILELSKAEAERDELDYLIDGLVIKVDSIALRQALGYTDRFPRWAIAYKFEALEMSSKLIKVTWGVGRTGKLTPLANIEPVDIGGVTVKAATLNNYGELRRKGIKHGCTVWVRRSNDVIPEITGTAGDGEGEIEKPEVCPECQSVLEERGANLFCLNDKDCRPQVVARVVHFASREAMNIETLNEKSIELFFDEFNLRNAADLYEIDTVKLVQMRGWGEKKVKNLTDALEKSKGCTLAAFINAIGIPNVGRKTAHDLAERFGSLDELRRAKETELVELDDIGDITAASIVGFFLDDGNAAHIDRLLRLGVRPGGGEAATGSALLGKSFVITGTLSKPRQHFEKLITGEGGKVSSSVSKNTDYLLAGEKAGSKLERALALGIEILDEEKLINLLG
ncbi:MAG: NAD-dependent DNA ligase LigA [Christensenellales bacterium]